MVKDAAKQMPTVSVVVPIFNQERYLEKCLDSLLAQTLPDIEIIGVDDGSSDKSGEIIDAYAAMHDNIRAIHQANAGLGPARNTGIEAANGRYIGFVDSDDWVHPDMYKQLYEIAVGTSADIIVEGHEEWTNGKLASKHSHPLAGRMLLGRVEVDACRELFYGRSPHDGETIPYPVSVWSQLYRRDLIESVRARFHEVLSEDVFFNLDVYKAAENVVFTGACGYCYRKDMQESITRTFTSEKTRRYTDFFNLLGCYAQAEVDPDATLLRARRKMVDYCRSYVFMVEKSGMTVRNKVKAVQDLAGSAAFEKYCHGYPLAGLPRFQALFHYLLVGGHFKSSLALSRFRMVLRGER